MNKTMITKYKKEFDHWLCSGSVLTKVFYSTSNKWVEIQSDYVWENTEAILVINDKYVEFRKAHAEGKTIELNDGSMNCPNWNKAFPCKTSFKNYPVKLYRIKLEPEFKVGDWVITDGSLNGEPKEFLARVTDIDTCQIPKETEFNNYVSSLDKARFWQPEVDEWCVFYTHTGDTSYTIARFQYSVDNRHYSNIGHSSKVAPLEYAITLKDI